MASDHADHAAATAAGYSRTQTDYGAGKSPRYVTTYEKNTVGETGTSGAPFRATATSDISQADADSKALTALNAERQHRYGGAPGRASGSANSPGSRFPSGAALTSDLH